MSTNENNQITIRDFEEEKLAEELGESIRKNKLQIYIKGKVGFFSYSDASAGIGGGSGHFLWFDSYHKLYQFLADYFVVLAPGRLDLDHEKVFQEVAGVVQKLAAGKSSAEEAIKQINDAGKHFSQIEWIGVLDDLIQGDGEFPKKVREYFFESREDEGSVKDKIGKDDQVAFLEFLGEYGI